MVETNFQYYFQTKNGFSFTYRPRMKLIAKDQNNYLEELKNEF